MPKRKSTPVRLTNSERENLSFSSINDSFNDEEEDTPPKRVRLPRVKTFTASIKCCNKDDEKYFIDRLFIGKSKNVIPEWKRCTVKASEGVATLNFHENYVVVAYEDNAFLEYLSVKSFVFNFDININTEEVYISIYIQLPLIKFNKKVGTLIKSLFEKKFGVEVKEEYDEKTIKNNDNLDEFYKDIHSYRKNDSVYENDINVQHSELLPQLRPYQVDAVKWMIEREKEVDTKEILHPLFEQIKLDSGEVVYINVYTGFIELDRPTISGTDSGGILADEMGLGKTVEVLACILNNPRPDFDVTEELTLKEEESTQSLSQNEENESQMEESQSNDSQIETDVSQINKSENYGSQVDSQDNGSQIDSQDDVSQVDSQDESSQIDSQDDGSQVMEASLPIQDKTVPKVHTQSKYVKPKVKKEKVKVVKEKAPRKRKGEDKPKPKQSVAKMAAQLWYENKLAEMKIKEKRKPRNEELEVQCVCGDLTEVGVIHCKDCNKMQHPGCLGYNGDPQGYICPQCWLNKPLIKSKATLIVSPLSICRQWSQEIQRHIRKGGLRVLIYKGIHNAGVMYPTNLANYDLIITTYNVLQSELKFTKDEQYQMSFRYAKRYNTCHTPLLNINFWRLCLDEAQMVDCPSSQVSQMAHQLNAVHRWAVTGTPIQKNISDLYGLIEYLKLSPYNDPYTWKNLLFYPYLHGDKIPLLTFLSQVLWRSIKSDVLTQINIPPQTILEHWFEFSAVEKYFYKKEHSLAANDFLDKLKNFESLDVRLKEVDKKVLAKILAPLLALRQACVHPHSVRGRYLAKSKVNSMEDLLEALIKKNVQECAESLRAMLAALNGMAGIMLLKDNSLEAVETYREALSVMSKYDKHQFIKIDKLQKVHTLYNLSDVLLSYPGVPPTLRDDKLADECEQVQKQYMEKFISETRSAFEDAQVSTETVTKLKKKFKLKEGEWLCELNDWFIMNKYEQELLRRVANSLDANCKVKYEDIASSRSIVYLLTTWMDKIHKKSSKLEKLFDQFQNEFCAVENDYQMTEQIVNEAMECHLRPSRKKNVKKNPCKICQLDKNLKMYECDIFLMKTSSRGNEQEKNVGSWHPSFEERLLKLIHMFGKQKGADDDLLKDGEIHLKLCESLRKEFKELRRLYTFYDKQISAQDELNICKIRFRLKNPEEPVKVIEKKKVIKKLDLDYEIENKYEFINVLNQYDLDLNYSGLIHEKKLAEMKLLKMIGTHNYLETLKSQQYSGQEPDPCPICANKLEDSWAIMRCGHCYCFDCLENLIDRSKMNQNISCSVCRAKQPFDDISYIKLKGTNDKNDDLEIQGSYSTKIQAITKHVIRLRQEDENVKILIFSSWQGVLKVLSEAFTKNNINFEHLTPFNLQEKLDNFKAKVVTACLIPISLGAKGLNLIEATHVFLFEPLINPGEELQAIGRVHRIGQTKPTFVHRFLIKGTIEENIHNAVSANVDKWDRNRLTLAQLKELFIEKDLNVTNDETEQEPSLIETTQNPNPPSAL